MEKLKLNPNNKKYYSDEFIKGFECGVERQFNVNITENTMEQTIEKLENIKAEIRNKRIIDPDFDFDTAGWCISLIERNIKELKAELKGEDNNHDYIGEDEK